ncbi:MAG: glycosyltransferase family 4 protein, partial [Promethearchaeota archaeon]
LNDVCIRIFSKKKPFVLHYQGGFLANWQLRIIKKYGIDCIITCSNFSANKIKHLLTKTKINVVHNGVNLKMFKPMNGIKNNLKEKLNLIDKTVLLYVGRIVPEKGLNHLIKALSLVKERFSDFVCICVGSGDDIMIYKELARSFGVLDNLYFWGSLPYQFLPKVYNLADIFVLPSLEEPFGIVLAEAQACGIPIVASNTGGISEVVEHEKSGILVPSKSPSELAAALIELLDDPSLRIEMGKAGRNRVIKNFSWEITAIKTEQIYQRVLTETDSTRNLEKR